MRSGMGALSTRGTNLFLTQFIVICVKGKLTSTLCKLNSRTSLPRAIGDPTDTLQFVLAL